MVREEGESGILFIIYKLLGVIRKSVESAENVTKGKDVKKKGGAPGQSPGGTPEVTGDVCECKDLRVMN